MEHFLLQFFIFLTSAAIAVPVAKKLGLGSVLGYLVAGIIIGPFGLSLIGDIEAIMHFTEFGVVMMLFLVGLELKPSLLWQMRTPILGIGGSQVILTSAAIMIIAMFFLSWQQALACGLILSLSSTAIVLQTLREKGLMKTMAGRSVFSVLLFQDLAVIPILAILPLLASLPTATKADHDHSIFDITALPTASRIAITLLAIIFIYILGRFASRPIFRSIAATRIREIFVASALALIVGISLLMTTVGLSPALGTFLAGVVLADSEYRHELESDIEPFKGLLLGIFFIAIGASLNFSLISAHILEVVSIVVALISIKWVLLTVTGTFFRMKTGDLRLFAIALAQGGEFAFVLFQYAKIDGILPDDLIELLVSAVAISMFLSPLLFIAHDKIAAKKFAGDTQKREADTIDSDNHRVILAGFGRYGTDIGRFLISAGIKPIILDHDAEHVEILRKFGFEVYYGDVTRLDLLAAAGAGEAELIIVSIRNPEKAQELITLVQKHYPHLKIAANAMNLQAAYALKDLGVITLRRETLDSALDLGEDALTLLGFHPYEAYKLKRLFRKKDEQNLNELYKIHREDHDSYISTYQRHSRELAELMAMDKNVDLEELDKAWSQNTTNAIEKDEVSP